MKNNLQKRILCVFLTLALVLGYVPVTAFAAETDGLCEHHTQHTEACGYSAAVEGHTCNHEHTEECYRSDTQCVHSHGNCSYVPAVEGQDCDCQPDENGVIVHTEGCGYVEAVGEVPCGHVCSEETGCVTQMLNCQHQHDEACGYAEEKTESPCTFSCEECAQEAAAQAAADVASGTCGKNLTWVLTDDGTLTISGTGAMADYDDEFSVPWYEFWSQIQSVVMSESVTSIGDYAFRNCSSLTSITIPESVTSIGDYAFCGCSSLTSITIPESVISIGICAFAWCDILTDITIPESVTSISDYMFSYCSSLTSITIPESVTSIGYAAFSDCSSLTSITIPESVTSIGDYAFRDCSSLQGIWVSEGNPYYCSSEDGVLFNKEKTTLLQCPDGMKGTYCIPDGVTSIGDSAFSGCSSLTDITIPESVTSIGERAFQGCSSLESITIPESVTSIGERAFQGCSSLESITIPEGVTSIGSSAFEDCSSLTSITIPESVTSIGDSAFAYCSSLTDITIPEGVTSINTSMFYGCDGLTSITIPESVTSIGIAAFEECSSLTSITIPESVTSIGDRAFSDCSSLTSITIPESVTSIGNEAFYYCRSLSSITIQEGVTSIGAFAFAWCRSLTSITIPESVTSIGFCAFKGCSSLTTISFKGNAPTIESNAFLNVTATAYYPADDATWTEEVMQSYGGTITWTPYGTASEVASGTCGENLTWVLTDDGTLTISGTGKMTNYSAPWYAYRSQIESVVVNEGVTSIGNSAFSGCSSLTSIIIPGSVTSIGDNAFYCCKSLTTVTIPEGVTSIGPEAFRGCTKLTSVTIPDGVTSIGSYTFCNCTSLTSVTIPTGVTSIGYSAFCNCTSLTSVTIPDSVTSIEHYAFDDCTSLTAVTYAGTMQQWKALYRYSAICSDGTIWGWGDCGSQGDNLTWTLINGVLTISGTGEMREYSLSSAPWRDYQNLISSVSVQEGVTSIGKYAFYDCTSLTSVAISEGVTSIGQYAFNNCTSLTSVIIPVSVTAIDLNIFTGCTGLSMMTYNGTTEQWMAMVYKFPAKCINGTIWDWGSCIRDLSYILDGNGVLAITGSGTIISYSRPENVPWYAYRAQIKKVTLPDGITQIGNYAFSNCTNLKSVNIPNGVESIGQSAFYRCSSLESVSFPNTLETIGGDAFTECTSLTEVRIPVSVTAIGEAAFCHCTSLTQIAFEHAYNSQLSIGHGAFSPYDDGSYGLPDPPINMATTVYVPSRLDINPAIRNYPWAGTSGCSRTVTYVSMASGISVGTTGDYHNEVAVGQSIPMVAEVDGVEDSTVTWSVENGTGTAVIDQNGVLTGLTTGAVTVYATAANGLEGSCTVNVLRYVEDITILLNGKQDIHRLGVGETLQLSALLTPEDTTTSGVTWTVKDGTGSASIKTYSSAFPELTGVSAGTVTLTATAKDSKQVSASLELTVTDTIRSYGVTGGNLYYNTETGVITGSDSTVTNATIPAVIDGVTITGIAPFAFTSRLFWGSAAGNTTLTSVSIPKTVTEIGDHAFYKCTNLSSLRFVPGSSLKTIGKEAFYGCCSLVNLTIPDSVTNIGDDAFSLGYNSNLKYLTISGELDTSNWLSYSYDTLESVTFTGSKIVGQPHRVENNSHYNTVCMPGRDAKKVIISDSVKTIEAHAFCCCDRLTDVTIGDGVTAIGDYAFCSCDNLTNINLPGSLKTVGKSCFYSCDKLQLIDLSAVPDVITERKTTLTGKADISAVLVRATGGKVKLGWRTSTIEGEPACWKIAGCYQDQSGQYQLETLSSGRFELSCYDEHTGAQGSKIVEVKVGTEIHPTDTDYLVSGGKLQLSVWQMPAAEKLDARWTITAGQDYATLSSTGLLTAKDVTQAHQITITATPSGGGNTLTKTIRILPKTTSIQLKQGDSDLGDVLDADMYAGRTLTLSAHSYPEGALNEISWTSSNSKIATVDQNTGVVTLKKPGTAVITAKPTDGSSAKKSVTLNVIYLDSAKTLKAAADMPAIGLQPGQTAQMTVTGTSPIDAGKLNFSSSNESVVSVDENGVITAGATPGAATITAALKRDPINREATVQVKVIPIQAASLTLMVDGVEDTEQMYSMSDAPQTAALTASALDYTGRTFTPSVTWASSDTSVATVDKAGVLTIPAKASGQCVITATANDLNKASAQLTISVRDYSPRLGSNTITLNSYSQQGVALDLRESYDNAIVSAALTNEPAGITLDSDTLTLYAEGVKNGTYNIHLNVTCTEGNYTYSLQVKVANSLPAVTVKQTEKLNLFYTDSTAALSITAPGQTIEKVALTGTADFQIEKAAYGVYVLNRTGTQPKKLTTRATLEVTLDGWSTPVTKTITISTATTAPKLSLTPASAVVRQADGIDPEVTLQVVDAEGNSIDPQYITCKPDFAKAESLVLTLTKKNSKGVYTGGTAILQVQLPTWTKPVVLKCEITVSTKSPTMKLGTASLTLRHYFAEEAAQTTVTLDQRNLALKDVTIVSTSRESAEAAKLGVTYESESGVITARIKDANQLPEAGTYTYSCTGKTNAGDTKSVTLKVVVSAAQPKVTLSAKGKLDTLNPDSTIVYTPKLTNCAGGINGVFPAGQDNGKFHAELADGKIVLSLLGGEDYATNVTYKVQFRVSVCGKKILSPVMNVKVTQSKVKLTAAPAALILYQSQKGPLALRLTQSIGEIDDVSISSKTSAELLAALGENGLETVLTGNTAALELTVENAALLKAGKSYTLYLDVIPVNNAKNLNPAQIKLTVKVLK